MTDDVVFIKHYRALKDFTTEDAYELSPGSHLVGGSTDSGGHALQAGKAVGVAAGQKVALPEAVGEQLVADGTVEVAS